jgi:hypothetical protein
MTWYAVASFLWTITTITYGLSGKGWDWGLVGMGAVFTGVCSSLALTFGLIAYIAGAFR